MSVDFVDRAFSDVRESERSTLACTPGHKDLVLYHLLQSMMPALASPDSACKVFIEQISIALGTHVFRHYAESKHVVMTTPRVLSRTLETRAKEMLLNGSAETRLIENVARQCNLSPSYFIFAFRQTTGQSPYRWLKMQRVKRACELLRHTDHTLAEIGLECGFADQSHFTKAFSQEMTVSPGAWRKAVRG